MDILVRIRVLFSVALLLTFIEGSLPHKAFGTCGSVEISGNKCDSLSVKLSFTNCKNPVKKPTIVKPQICKNGLATLEYQQGFFVYKTTLTEEIDDWGDRTWTSRPLEETKLPTPKKIKKIKKKVFRKKKTKPKPVVSKKNLKPKLNAIIKAEKPVAPPSPQKSTFSEPTINLDYDVNITHSSNGFEEDPPNKVTEFGQSSFLSFQFKPHEAVEGVAYVKLADSLQNSVEVAMVTYTRGEYSLSVGKNYLNYGGYDNKNWGFETVIVSPYTEFNSPLPSSATMVSMSQNISSFGSLTLQLTDDVVASRDNSFISKSRNQPAALIEWAGDFGAGKPLIQVVPYDGNRSLQVSAGFAWESESMSLYVDVVLDQRATQGDEKTEKLVFLNYDLDLTINLSDIQPFLKFTTFSAKQPDNDDEANADSSSYDDNGTAATIGSNFPGFNDFFVPYFALTARFAKIYKNPKQLELGTDTKSHHSLVMGIGGSL